MNSVQSNSLILIYHRCYLKWSSLNTVVLQFNLKMDDILEREIILEGLSGFGVNVQCVFSTDKSKLGYYSNIGYCCLKKLNQYF